MKDKELKPNAAQLKNSNIHTEGKEKSLVVEKIFTLENFIA